MRVKQLLRQIIRSRIGNRVSGAMLQLATRANPELLLRPTQAADAAYPLEVPARVAATIDMIPTESTWRERRFLYRYFADHWIGQNDVVEVGPFLGGTTRGIALGMLDNPRLSQSARLRTFDRFHSYHTFAGLRERLQPLIDAGTLLPDALDSGDVSVDFLEIFNVIHGSTPYSRILEASSRPLPDFRSETTAQRQYLTLSEPTSAAFVDGCKSWFGTKYFMIEVAKVATPGAVIVFQDFGCRTCFWVTAFAELFDDHLRLFARVDDTYAFSIIKPITPEEIENRFPDHPEQIGSGAFKRLYDNLVRKDKQAGDAHGAFIHRIHTAAALAYIGDKSEAAAILHDLAGTALSRDERVLLKEAQVSPTYSPTGVVTLP